MQESREHIKTRMLRNAARAWGYAETESESSFDPLVSMLLSACSVELEKISGEIQGSRARVLERLVQLLSPDAFTGALPAHAVACARPVDAALDIAGDAQYYITRKIAAAAESEEPVTKDVFFSPTGNFHLNRATIRFMATGTSLYRMNGITKELITQSDTGKDLPASTLWLGIDEPGTSISQGLFHFDLRNEAEKQLFYHQLPKAKWYWNDQLLPHSPGYGQRTISGEQLDLETVLNREDDISGKIKKQVNAFYKPYFITLLDPENIATGKDATVLGDIIAETFTGKGATPLKQQALRWICIDFPQTITSRLLQDVVCVMNSFPVVNRRLHDLTYRLQELVNIIPLHADDLFFDLETVTNDEGRILNTRNFQQKEEEAFGVLLRNGGVGRFDERDAASIVDYLVQLLRDESAAFSTLGNDFMNTEMKQIQQIINKLEQRLFAKQQSRGQTPYLMVRNHAKAPWQNIFLRYWSTCGAEGNHIKAGTQLRLYRGSSLEGNQVILVTTTLGGRNKLGTADSVLAYKTALLSKDRLVTMEDIRTFCHYQLGNRVKQITIEKGVMIHPDQQQGFLKTLDVKISLPRKDFEDMEEKGEISFWIDNLQLLLEEKSVALLPYRVFIEKAA
jgi:hypothetical protein